MNKSSQENDIMANNKTDEVQTLEEAEIKELNLHDIEDIINYKFNNKNLLEEAFTHPSYKTGFSYERLEYFGDSVLGLLITREHFALYPNLAPGKLTRLRSANVDTEKLARVALSQGFHRYLRHKKPFLDEQIQHFSQEVNEFPIHSNGLIDAPKNLADLVEALIGAVFIDCDSNMDTVWHVFKGLLEPIVTLENLQVNFHTQVLEMCQKQRKNVSLVSDTWEKDRSVKCVIQGRVEGIGTYDGKKNVAVNRAAKDALDNQWRWIEGSNEEKEEEVVKNVIMESRSSENDNRVKMGTCERKEEVILEKVTMESSSSDEDVNMVEMGMWEMKIWRKIKRALMSCHDTSFTCL